MREALVWLAGEASGDLIASLVIKSLLAARPGIAMQGVGGERMRLAGTELWYSSEMLSVRGYVEVLGKLPQLLWLRHAVASRVLREKPAAFIGVDAPDFNLGLEAKLRSRGVKTIQLVCPAFWAWRAGRVRTIRQACDLVLCIFPFEKALLEKEGVAAAYIGHPLASVVPEKPDRAAARKSLGEEADAPLFAVLPGSRASEVSFCGPVFFEAAEQVLAKMPRARFLVPSSGPEREAQIRKLLESHEALRRAVRLVPQASHAVLEASDAVLVSSGTATLEAALMRRPMVVGYALPAVTAWLTARKGNTRFVSLPNILAGRKIVPECLAYYCTPEILSQALIDAYGRREDESLMREYEAIYASLRRDTPRLASEAVFGLTGL